MQFGQKEIDRLIKAPTRVDPREEAVDLIIKRFILLTIGVYAIACLITFILV